MSPLKALLTIHPWNLCDHFHYKTSREDLSPLSIPCSKWMNYDSNWFRIGWSLANSPSSGSQCWGNCGLAIWSRKMKERDFRWGQFQANTNLSTDRCFYIIFPTFQKPFAKKKYYYLQTWCFKDKTVYSWSTYQYLAERLDFSLYSKTEIYVYLFIFMFILILFYYSFDF